MTKSPHDLELDRELALDKAVSKLRAECLKAGVELKWIDAVVRATNNLIGPLYTERRTLSNALYEKQRKEDRDTTRITYDSHSELGLLK